jgi:hypothetical protein
MIFANEGNFEVCQLFWMNACCFPTSLRIPRLPTVKAHHPPQDWVETIRFQRDVRCNAIVDDDNNARFRVKAKKGTPCCEIRYVKRTRPSVVVF